MAYKLTPYDRRVQAELIRQEREAKFASRYPTYKKTGAAAVAPVNNGKDPNAFLRVLQTGLDVGNNVAGGVWQSVEGLVDLVATGVGAVGGIFSDDFQDGVKDFVATDYTDELFMQNVDKLTEGSYLNEGRAGEIIEGVSQGVGQMLPDVLISVATMGTYAGVAGAKAAATAGTAAAKTAAKTAAKAAVKQAAIKAGQRAAMVSLAAHATGSGIQEAFADGASYGEGMAYGALTGATEVATEKLTGGFGKLYGGGVLKGGAKQVAKVGAKRVLSEMAGEGAEEMISEATNPLRKTIYKGKDALKEYSDEEFWGGVLEAGAVGALTSAAYGGTVGRINKTSGVYADANSVAEHIEQQKKMRGKSGLSQADRVQIEKNIKAVQELLSGRLQKLSEKSRAKVFEKMPTFKAMFEADGTIKAEQAAALDAKIKAAGDATYHADIRSSTADAERITEALKNGSTEANEMRAYTGEMSETQRQNADAVREFMGAASERSGGVVGDYVIAEKAPEGPAYFDKKTGLTVIGMDAVENGTALEAVTRELEKAGWQEAVVHETYHAIENTRAGQELTKLVTDNEVLHDLAVADVLKRGYMKEHFGENADVDAVSDGIKALVAKENNGEVLTEQERKALKEYKSEVGAFANQRLLGNKAFVKKLITTEPSTAEKLIAKIREIRENLMIRNPSAKAQLELVRKAEKLFMQGLSEAGGTIDATGKIHLANREEDEEKGKVRRLMAGEHAKTADKMKLATAQQMIANGADSETVRRETGWYQGYDGKWRFEISDLESFLIENPDLEKHTDDGETYFTGKLSDILDHKDLFAAYPDMKDINIVIQKTDFGVDGIYQPRSNCITLSIEQFKRYTKAYSDHLNGGRKAEIAEIESSEAYKEYNRFYDDEVVDAMEPTAWLEAEEAARDKFFSSDLGKRYYQLMWGKENGFSGDKFEFGWGKAAKAVLLHELQHAVQNREGFASGANTRDVNYDRNAGEIEARDVANRAELTTEQRKNTRPDIDRSDVVFAGSGTVSYFAKSEYDAEKAGIHEQIRNSQNTLNEMEPVFSSEVPTYVGDKEQAGTWAIGELKRFGFQADRQNFGKIYFDETSIRDAMNYLDTDAEKVSIVALYKVLKRGVQIGEHGNHKMRGKHTVTFAAPVVLNGIRGNMAVVVNMRNNKYKVHRILMPDNSFFKFDETKKNAAQESQRGVPKGSLANATSAASNTSISQTEPIVNPSAQKNSGKVSRSRNVTGETVTISKGEMAKLHANYAGDKVFTKGAVTEALKGIDALKVLPAARRAEIANEIWRGYNKRLHQQGFELFTELEWHQLHAEILQENNFEMSEDDIRVMDEQIVNALEQIVQSGKPSIKARLENDTSTEGYRKQADFWRGEHSKAVQRNKQLNSLKFELEKLANQKKGLYVNAANFRGDSFKVAIDELAKMNWRGGLVNDTKIRERFAKLAAWYTKENPLYKGDGGGNELFRQEIADALAELSNSQNGALTAEDLMAAETVVKYFAHEIEAHNTVYKDGKRVDAMPEAKSYIEKVRRAKEMAAKCGIWSNLMRSKFARMVADPAMLMRQADGYLSGFFTEQYEALRQGTIDAAVLERELSEEFEQFWEKNKAYAKRYNDATVTFGDTEMPLQEAISLYMTMKREHAFAGLAGAGFEIEGKEATEEISAGFADEVNRQLAEDWKALPPEELLTLTKRKNAEMEQAALKKVVEQKRQALYDQFTAEDKALISLMERAFEQCRDVKVEIDEIVQGYSNVTGGYYYPIKRTGRAENVDAYTGLEGDRVTNLSMNKETVKNAHKLLIEPAHIVFMRHLKATSLYHGLGVFTDNFNRLYNLDITGPQIKNAAERAVGHIDLSTDDELSSRVKGVYGAKRYKAIAEYIQNTLGRDNIKLSDGRMAIVDNRDAMHIANKAAEKKTAQIARIKELVEQAQLFAKDEKAEHEKFDMFYYYMAEVTFEGETFPIYLNVGRAKNNGQFHIYDITNKIRDTADRINGLERPVGNALTNGIPSSSISQNGGGVNTAGLENYRGGPKTVRDALGQSNNYTKEMVTYFKELKQDVERISKKRNTEKWYNDAVAFIRSSYATYQLGANPKVWVTQLSSLIAATNIIDADCLAKGLAVSGKDVDEYCRLAWLRNNDSSAAQAQAVGTSQNAVQRASRNVLQKIRDVAMLPIGKVDRLVITRLFGACQVQVEKKGGAKVGTKENKIAAGKLLQRVILETQQNSLATERSAAMRSGDELLKGFTMFSADAMKVGARFVDAFGELSVLRTLRREAKKAGNSKEMARLDTEIKRARKQCVRATVSLVGVALFNAALAYGFKWLYRRDEDESIGTFIADTFGNMLGGIPFVRDLWSFFQDGFEMDHFLISTVNDVLGTAAASFELVSDAVSGKEVTRQEVLANMRKVVYAAGQLSGVPTRNLYNFTTGVVNRVSPEAGYALESQFFKQSFASDLKKALDAGDDKMVGTIAGLMIDEKIGIEDDAVRDVLHRLTEKGHAVLPRSVGDSVTVDGETVTLTGAQQKKLRAVYGIGQEAVADMVKLKQFQSAGDEVQAAAIKFVYDVYWDLALEDALGLDLAEKNVLFAEAIDIEKLAVIIATARAIEADKDKDGKAIAGTKKRKLQTFVNSLRLSAAEKYMVMGYLGYSNINGESAVKAHISKLNLSASEKEKLLGYSGYGA